MRGQSKGPLTIEFVHCFDIEHQENGFEYK